MTNSKHLLYFENNPLYTLWTARLQCRVTAIATNSNLTKIGTLNGSTHGPTRIIVECISTLELFFIF